MQLYETILFLKINSIFVFPLKIISFKIKNILSYENEYIIFYFNFSTVVKTVIGFKRNLLDPQVFLGHYVLVHISKLHFNYIF